MRSTVYIEIPSKHTLEKIGEDYFFIQEGKKDNVRINIKTEVGKAIDPEVKNATKSRLVVHDKVVDPQKDYVEFIYSTQKQHVDWAVVVNGKQKIEDNYHIRNRAPRFFHDPAFSCSPERLKEIQKWSKQQGNDRRKDGFADGLVVN